MLVPNEDAPIDWDGVLDRISNGEVPSEFCGVRIWGLPDSPGEIERKAHMDRAFAARLAEAKRLGAQAMVADCVRIAKDRHYRVDERKLMIDARKYLAALWNAECNPKTVVEQTTTVKNLTPREDYIEQLVQFTGCDREQAGAQYDRRSVQ